ncbi:molecular chaperone DnaJ [Desulfovibrio desulfuricans]|uniref:Molecular chaperone DnaJ n=1 Tax=Desulfovibrio desulfuricans TaxID=876 RepID=A0A4P7UKN1_DESDE|nr:J domain-containing protein [Desulfovibrio desulfuricans]QCC85368.1 molecular chaperone DnaJ [Desulfovibrio desulfuricans]
MRRRHSRQISLKECYDILKLKKDADTADLKRAYRRRAFELHPDLNPDNPEASREFQLLNEAYVALSAVLKHEDTVQAATETSRAAQEEGKAQAAKDEAAEEKSERQASAQAEKESQSKSSPEGETPRQDAAGGASGPAGAAGPASDAAGNQQQRTNGAAAGQQAAQNGYSEHDVLRDLLTDPFARRVFEDIYSELNRQQQEKAPPRQEEPAPEQPRPKPAAAEKRTVRLHQSNLAWGTPKWNKDHSKGVTGMVKGWLRRQIDEEQTLALPSANLAPGKRVRLQIRQAISGELKTVDITLPPDFAVGKPIRLRGLGKRVGPWQGDLYLILTNE